MTTITAELYEDAEELDRVATLRNCIVSSKGYTFVSMDAIQIELKKVAILSGDPLMIEASKSSDMHMATAIQVFGNLDDEGNVLDPKSDLMKKRRYDAKQMNFAILYGATAYKIAEMSEGKLTEEEAQELIDKYFSIYHVLGDWIESEKKKARENGFVVTEHGRIRPIPGIQSTNWREREAAEREVVNTIVQGSAVDTVKLMMLHMRGILDKAIRLVLNVHDEMLWEVPDAMVDDTVAKCRTLAEVFPDYPCHISVGKQYGGLVELT